MRFILKTLTVISLGVLSHALAACGAAKPETYQSVAELKDAYIKASGATRTNWRESEYDSSEGSQAGQCGDSMLFVVYDDDEARLENMTTLKRMWDGVPSAAPDYLAGANWYVTAPEEDLNAAAKRMGTNMKNYAADPVE